MTWECEFSVPDLLSLREPGGGTSVGFFFSFFVVVSFALPVVAPQISGWQPRYFITEADQRKARV